jgi:hypothetical protein
MKTISNYLSRNRPVYARHVSIVNSSGTGKSRIVDEVAREIITVPMCLREDGTQGFDPVPSFFDVLITCPFRIPSS